MNIDAKWPTQIGRLYLNNEDDTWRADDQIIARQIVVSLRNVLMILTKVFKNKPTEFKFTRLSCD